MKKTEAHPARSLGFLSRLYDGEVPPAERAEFDLHRRVCPECAAAADEFEAVLALYRNAEIPEVDPGLSARITRRIDRELRHPESARFVPVKIDLVWASVVIVALAGAIATYSLVRPKAARVVVLAEKKPPAVAPAPAFAPQAPPAANQAAEPERQARSRSPERRASTGAQQPVARPAEAPSAAPSGAPLEEGRLDADLSRKAETAPAPTAAMAAPEAMTLKEQPAAGGIARDESKKEIEEPIQVGPGVTPPDLIKKVEPRYPEPVKGRTVTGAPVILEAVVSAQGNVEKIRVVRSNPPFDQAVIDAVRQWKYKPAMKDGKPVAVYLTVTVNLDVK